MPGRHARQNHCPVATVDRKNVTQALCPLHDHVVNAVLMLFLSAAELPISYARNRKDSYGGPIVFS
jgi:hypothetical protein